MLKIGLVPDRFTHYRYPIFKLLSQERKNDFSLVIFADTEDVKEGIYRGVNAIDPRFCDLDIENGGVRWERTHDFYLKGVCVWQTGLIKIALDRTYDVIVYWGDAYRLSTWVSALIARFLGKKVVFWTHGIYGNENWFKFWLRIYFYRVANALLLYGSRAKRLLKPFMNPGQKMHVINNSLDYEIQDSIYKKLSDSDLIDIKGRFFSPEDKVLCFIGRLEPRKKLHLLLDALIRIRANNTAPIKLLIIGDGSERANLEALTAQLGLTNDVVFYGACYDDEETVPLLAMSDILVSPGGVGLAAMHALISGTPIITHNDFSNQMPEVEAIQDGVNGCFFANEDSNDLADKILDCFRYLNEGVISAESCRNVILTTYTPDFQRDVFIKMLKNL